ncbi:MAG: hypothetical protein ABSD62_07715 [Candidatus Limnocylindrales bacterium]
MDGADRPSRFDPEPPGAAAGRLTVIAQDPAVKVDGAVLRAVATIPLERLEPGPRGPRFWVVDYDSTARRVVAPAPDPWVDTIASCPDGALASDPRVRAQNVYVVASRTLESFENALGRRLGWGFAGHQLYLVPAAFAEANAFYDPDSCAVLFGYFQPADPPGAPIVYTSLSHDIVAHETTHAILDGLRPRFEEPSLPDQAAFHEALADIVALMSVFSMRETVLALIPGDPDTGLVDEDKVNAGELARTALLGLAEQFGAAVRVHGGDALRRSVTLAANPSMLSDPAFKEPHARGEVLVAAVGNAMLEIWTRRLVDVHAKGTPLHRTRVADEGVKTAGNVLAMCIRAIDYLPPVDLSFDDFATALLAADEEVVPDDRHDYRGTLEKAFSRYGIREARPRHVQTFGRKDAPTYRLIHEEELRIRRSEVFRLLWQNATLLDIPTDYYLSVETVTPCARVAPDGFVVREVVATYIQMLDGTAAELRALAARLGGELAVPDGVSDTTRLELLGGGTVIFDEFGRLRYHQPKPLLDWGRQSRRLDYLVRNGLRDTHGGVGYSQGTPLGQRFAVMHAQEPDTLGETW